LSPARSRYFQLLTGQGAFGPGTEPAVSASGWAGCFWARNRADVFSLWRVRALLGPARSRCFRPLAGQGASGSGPEPTVSASGRSWRLWARIGAGGFNLWQVRAFLAQSRSRRFRLLASQGVLRPVPEPAVSAAGRSGRFWREIGAGVSAPGGSGRFWARIGACGFGRWQVRALLGRARSRRLQPLTGQGAFEPGPEPKFSASDGAGRF
jgi:hypothetical protein